MPDPSTAPDLAPAASRDLMTMLGEHVPVSLLLDLAAPAGPASVEILQAEGRPLTPWWEMHRS